MKPQLNTKGREQLNRARATDEEEYENEDGKLYLARSPIVEPADLVNEAAMASTRKKRSQGRGSKLRRELTQRALALYTAGQSMNEIAASLGVTTPTVTQWFVQHRRLVAEGDIDKMLDETAVPLAAENLVHGLLAGDKDYTLETLKGRGKLKRHTEGEGKMSVELPALVVRFETPQMPEGQKPIGSVGAIHGTASQPKQLNAAPEPVEGELVPAEKEIVGVSS